MVKIIVLAFLVAAGYEPPETTKKSNHLQATPSRVAATPAVQPVPRAVCPTISAGDSQAPRMKDGFVAHDGKVAAN